MYVVTIDDNGEERNFLATLFEIERDTVAALICGARKVFPHWNVLDVFCVETMTSVVAKDDRGRLRRHGLC